MKRRSFFKGLLATVVLAVLAPVQKVLPKLIWSKWTILRTEESHSAVRHTLNHIDGYYMMEFHMVVPKRGRKQKSKFWFHPDGSQVKIG